MKRKGPARDLKKELYWRGILRQHRQSGLTIRDFCRKKGLTESLFYAWRREVKHRRPANGGRTGKGLRPSSTRPTFGRCPVRPGPSQPVKPRTNGASFVPVKLSNGLAVSSCLDAVECHLPSGAVLRCPPSMGPAAVPAASSRSFTLSATELMLLLRGIDLSSVRQRKRYQRAVA